MDHNGYQLDTPEVAHAKAAHFAAHAEANARNYGHGLYHGVAAPVAYAGHYGGHYAGHYAGPQHIPVIGPHGVPLDTPEVAHARAAHLAAHASAHHGHGLVHYRKRRGILAAPLAYAHAYPQHIPVLDHNGFQLDTPEVAHAKAAHFAAHAEAHSRNAHVHVPAVYAGHAVAAPVAYAGHYGGHYAGPQHIPVIGPHGVPLDTPEVAHARAAHAAAHHEAAARSHGHYY